MSLMLAKKYKRIRVELQVASEFVKSLVQKGTGMSKWAEEQQLDNDTKKYIAQLEHLIEWMKIEWNFGKGLRVNCIQCVFHLSHFVPHFSSYSGIYETHITLIETRLAFSPHHTVGGNCMKSTQ